VPVRLPHRARSVGWLLFAAAACGCSSETHSSTADEGTSHDAGARDAPAGNGGNGGGSSDGNGGAKSSGGASNDGGTPSNGGNASVVDGGADSGTPGASTLPNPPGPANVPQPSGAQAHFTVLPWAGFKAAASYTFDDSQPSQIAHYAELAATGVRATYYVNTSNKGLANYDATWKKAASAGNEIGNHTVDHCRHDLTNCSGTTSAGSIDAEIDQCTAYIESNLGQATVWTMAFPYGDAAYEPDAKKRFFIARGVGGGMIAPLDSTDPFNLPVFAAAGGETAEPFSGAIETAHGQGEWVVFLFHSLLPGDNWYAGVDIGSVTGSITHAQSLVDVWLDTVAEVGAYFIGQKLVQAASATAPIRWTLPAHFPPGRYVRAKVDGGQLSQSGHTLPWNGHGFYEIALDAGELIWSP
jgi:hypothetical protein